MTSRSRDTRRNTPREPAVWRGTLAQPLPEGDLEQAHASGRVFVTWRALSALILIVLGLVLSLFFVSDAFYVKAISVGGLETMTREEVFAIAGVANVHLFWVDPAQVRADLLRSPTIADASVVVDWPPNAVQIVIKEREPALVWEQAGLAVWIDVNGRVMRQRENRPDLLRVQADPIMDGEPSAAVEGDVIAGALQLHQLMPERQTLRYHPDYGLGFDDPGGWVTWLGVGMDMPNKMLVYRALVTDLQRRGAVPSVVNVIDPDAPHWCCKR